MIAQMARDLDFQARALGSKQDRTQVTQQKLCARVGLVALVFHGQSQQSKQQQ